MHRHAACSIYGRAEAVISGWLCCRELTDYWEQLAQTWMFFPKYNYREIQKFKASLSKIMFICLHRLITSLNTISISQAFNQNKFWFYCVGKTISFFLLCIFIYTKKSRFFYVCRITYLLNIVKWCCYFH